jgi:hypothetical protein
MLLCFPLPRLFGSSQGLLCQARTELEQTSGYLAHDLAHLVVGRMKRRGSMAASPLDCVSDNLSLATIHQVAAVGVVVQGARGGIQPNRLLHPVFAPANLPDGITAALIRRVSRVFLNRFYQSIRGSPEIRLLADAPCGGAPAPQARARPLELFPACVSWQPWNSIGTL